MSAVRCETIRNISEWLAHREAITALLSSSSCLLPHSTMTWLTSWWKAFGGKQELQVGLFWEGDQLIGYAPLMITEYDTLGVHYSKLHFIGEGESNLSDYHDIFSRNDDLVLKQAIVGIILNDWEWDQLSLINIPENSNTWQAMQSYQAKWSFFSIRPTVRCPYIAIKGSNYSQYIQSLSPFHRRELGRRLRKLEATGPIKMQINAECNPSALFDMFKSLHTKRAEVKNWSSMYDFPGFKTFFCALLESKQPDMEVVYSTLHAGDVLVAYQLGFVTGRTYQSWNTGYREDYTFCSPVKLLTRFTIEECFRRGYDEFNYSRSDSKHKLLWTQTCRQNQEIWVLRNSPSRFLLNLRKWIKVRDPDSVTERFVQLAKKILVMLRLRPPAAQAVSTEEKS